MKTETMVKITMSWVEYSNSWLPFVKGKERTWDMSYFNGLVTVLCSEELYNEFENQ